jgi:two-component system, NarL family, sensor kinase
VDLDLPPDMQRLPPDAELALFRVVQEALTNVARHSGSATALIRLARERHAGREIVVLTVEDAGRGMPGLDGTRAGLAEHRPAGSGVGLASMRERLEQLGGRLKIHSGVGRTVITATLPIEA